MIEITTGTNKKPHLHIVPGSGDCDTNGPVPADVTAERIRGVAETYREAGYTVTIASEKYVPTRAEVNRLAAELIGYTVWQNNDNEWICTAPGFYVGKPIPDFCSPDAPHSLTAQLLAKVLESGKWVEFVLALPPYQDNEGDCESVAWCVLCTSPLIVTVACLRACNVWPENWSVSTE